MPTRKKSPPPPPPAHPDAAPQPAPSPPRAAAVASGPRPLRRIEWLPLLGVYGEWGFKARMVCNWEHRHLQGINRRSIPAVEEALALILEHNGWLNMAGEPLPPIADTPGFWWRDDISPELVEVALETLRQAPHTYPKSLRGS